MILNTLLIIIILAALMVTGYVFVQNREKTAKDFISENAQKQKMLSEDALVDHVKLKINEMVSDSLHDKGLSNEEYIKQKAIMTKLKVALRESKFGLLQDKLVVKDHIYGIVRDYVGNDINQVIKFTKPDQLTYQDKFEILLYVYKEIKGYGFEALKRLIQTDPPKESMSEEEYKEHIESVRLDREKTIIESGNTVSYIVSAEEVEEVFDKHVEFIENLSHRDKLQIITQRVYQRYKGLGVIDEIRDMMIDGVSGGVSGDLGNSQSNVSVEDYFYKVKNTLKFYDSVWIMMGGRSIHLAFLTFGSEEELKRVCQNIYKYNKVGQLTESDGFKINEMKDGSRVVVLRPPVAESWAFFVRKFDLPDNSLEDLIKDQDLITFLKFLVKGARVTAITGSQGSGKTTLLMALVQAIYATLTLRIQETAFELHLRNIYPNRNILSLKETDTVSGQAGLDVQKKTDGSVNILGEVATDAVTSWMIQMAQVASLFTLFTHHAKTANDLVLSIRNSLLRTGAFASEKIAEEQVAAAIDFDVHLERTDSGKRYISRITELNVAAKEDYPTDFMAAEESLDAMKAFFSTATEYFRRKTDRETFETRDIVVYVDDEWKFINPPTSDTIAEMKSHMTYQDRYDFEIFLKEKWGDEIL